MDTILYEGRMVSTRWHARYVVRGGSSPARRPKIYYEAPDLMSHTITHDREMRGSTIEKIQAAINQEYGVDVAQVGLKSARAVWLACEEPRVVQLTAFVRGWLLGRDAISTSIYHKAKPVKAGKS